MYFYEIMLDIMDKKSLSIPEVARATGLHDSTIRSIITRKSKSVALDVAAKISEGLNVELDYLNGGAANKNVETKKEPPHKTQVTQKIIDVLIAKGIIKEDTPISAQDEERLLGYLESSLEAYKKLNQ